MPEWETIVPNIAHTGSAEPVEVGGEIVSVPFFVCSGSFFGFFHYAMGFQCMCDYYKQINPLVFLSLLFCNIFTKREGIITVHSKVKNLIQ